jgi:hypothetical protein
MKSYVKLLAPLALVALVSACSTDFRTQTVTDGGVTKKTNMVTASGGLGSDRTCRKASENDESVELTDCFAHQSNQGAIANTAVGGLGVGAMFGQDWAIYHAAKLTSNSSSGGGGANVTVNQNASAVSK